MASSSVSGSGEEVLFKNVLFTIYRHNGHPEFWTMTSLTTYIEMLNMKFD